MEDCKMKSTLPDKPNFAFAEELIEQFHLEHIMREYSLIRKIVHKIWGN